MEEKSEIEEAARDIIAVTMSSDHPDHPKVLAAAIGRLERLRESWQEKADEDRGAGGFTPSNPLDLG